MVNVWTDEQVALLESGRVDIAGLVRVHMATPVRLWTGFGDFPIKNSAFDFNGDVYKSGARLITLPVFQRLMNGIAERITYVMSGVSEEMTSLVPIFSDEVRGAIVRLGLATLDQNYKQVGNVIWVSRGRIDILETVLDSTEEGPVRTIEISAGSLATGRKIGATGTFTNADQQSRGGTASTDKFFERTPALSVTVQKAWPP